MLDDVQQQTIVTRLNRIEGQVRGIRRMVQEPRLCVEILQQLSAAEAALNRISLAVFKFHVEKCVPEAIEKGEKILASLGLVFGHRHSIRQEKGRLDCLLTSAS